MSGTILRQGESMNSYYMRKWAGVDPTNGDPLWYINGKDGATTNKYAEAKEAIQGTSLNKVTGGFGTNISYKGISLDAFFTYGFGGKYLIDGWAIRSLMVLLLGILRVMSLKWISGLRKIQMRVIQNQFLI